MNTPNAQTNLATPWAGARDGDAAVIAELAKQTVLRHSILKADDFSAPHLVWPDKTLQNLEPMLAQPLRKRGKIQQADPESFAAYVNQFKAVGTLITGTVTEQAGAFIAWLDYHQPYEGAPQWTEHQATLSLTATPEWARWLVISGRELDQKTFAEFLEDNAVDLTVPEGEAGRGYPTQQELMSVASTLQIKTDVKFASSLKLANGQVQLGYVENIEAGHGSEGKLTIPERFGLAIAPFTGTPKYLVTARLRYRGTGGKAIFRVEIERPHKIVEHAWNDVRLKIEQLTGLRPLQGTLTPQTR